MISEEQLTEWQSELYEKPVDPQKVVALITEVRELRERQKREVEHLTISIHERLQLEKEADWLANAASCINAGRYFKKPYPLCTDKHEPEEEKCVRCWREAARKAVNND